MISHELKTIFIHIPRTGGTSIETALVGDNWWKIHPETKHIDWSQAKKMYSEFWGTYLKFTVVRNPWDWLVSLYYSHNRGGEKTWAEYVRDPNLVGHEQSPMLQSKIIGEEMDFVLHFETFHEDFISLCQQLGTRRTLPHLQVGDRESKSYPGYYNKELRELVAARFGEDIRRFGYKFAANDLSGPVPANA